MKKMDHRFYPEGRKRVYLSPAHMDVHCGDHGFYVEVMNGSYALGFYNKAFGIDSARVVNREIYQIMKALAREADKKYGQSCGNKICESALKQRMKKK
jgi:hypothetical protein